MSGSGLRLGWRISETLLASGVFALDAHLVGAKGGQTAVTVTTDAHADRLLDPFDFTRRLAGDDTGRRGGHARSRAGDPFAWFESEAIFGEEGAGAFFLHGRPLARSRRASVCGW